jgi:hypothetical protein
MGGRVNGRRLEVLADPETGKPRLNTPLEPGDYCGPILGYTGDLPAVFFLKPNARDEGAPPAARSVQHVCSPPHAFTEEPDGTLTIAPSISDRKSATPGGPSDGWHGYLENGVWREC